MARQAGEVAPIRQRVYDPELGVEVSRVIGYRGRCPCGERSDLEPTWRLARQWLTDHRDENHE